MKNLKAVSCMALLATIAYSYKKENNSTSKAKTHWVGNAMIIDTGPIQ